MSLSVRKLTSGATRVVWVALIFAAVVLLNLIAARTPARIDLTADDRYTLAEPSAQIARELPGPVRIELYFSADLPPAFEQMRRDLTDLLAEYEAYSDGRLTYTFVDPTASEHDRERAAEYGVVEWALPVSSQTEVSVRRAWTGLAMFYDDPDGTERVESIERLVPGDNYEYNLTRTLRDLATGRERPVIGMLVGIGGLLDPILDSAPPVDMENPQNPVSPREQLVERLEADLAAGLDDLFTITLVDAREDYPEGLQGLFVVGPTATFDEAMQRRLDAFVMSGRPVALFVSPYRYEELNLGNGLPPHYLPAANETGLEAMLAHYGVELARDAIFEVNPDNTQLSAERWQVQMQGRIAGSTWVPTQDPRLPIMPELSLSSLLVPQMNMVAFLPLNREDPLSQSSLRLTDAARAAEERGAIEVDEVFATSASSYRLLASDELRTESLALETLDPYLAFYDQDPDNDVADFADPGLAQGPFATGLTLVGSMTSALGEGAEIPQTDQGRLFVVSNGYWMQSQFLRQDPLLQPRVMGGLPRGVVQQIQSYVLLGEMLFRNTVDWLAQDNALVRIRARGLPAFADTTALGDDEKSLYTLFNIAGVPAIFCFLGVCGFLVRQNRRARIASAFGGAGSATSKEVSA